jgi:hypothetical protein
MFLVLRGSAIVLYLHVSKRQLVKVVNPLDNLWKKEEIEWEWVWWIVLTTIQNV